MGYEQYLDVTALEAAEYLEKFHIKEVMEAMVVGMTVNKPRDPLEYMEICVKRIRDNDLISNYPTHDRIQWNSFLTQIPRQAKRTRGIVHREVAIIPAITPFKPSASENPLLKKQSTVIPAIKPLTMTSKAWRNIIFILGGPGSGKGTQCLKLAKDYNYAHISAGDVLREEVTKGTSLGKELENLMKEGQMVSSETTLRLLKKAMHKRDDQDGFLIDGFPRTLDQVYDFEKVIGKAKFAVYYECDEEILLARLTERGLTSGRSDDNPETIKKRFKAFQDASMPAINYLLAEKRCFKIFSTGSIEEVYEQSEKLFKIQPVYHNNIVFVLGGPGSGKGTQCVKLAQEFNLIHLSTGDLLRDEVNKKTEVGLLAADLMQEGQMVPSSILMDILKKKIDENKNDVGFLIDGFPRSMDQAIEFEQKIGPCRAVLAYQCSLETLQNRLLERGKTSGRADDNMATIHKRFETFQKQSEPVIEYFKEKGKCTEIKSENSVEYVYEESKKLFSMPKKLNHPNIVFVIGPPGAGKGTQSFMLVKEYKYKHISTGDLIRREVLKETPLGLQVQTYLANGQTAPIEIIFFLLKQEIAKHFDGAGILIDGFPASIEQALEFERIIGEPRAVISLTCPPNVLEERISGQDNRETFLKRINGFKAESQPVIDYYFRKSVLYQISSNAPGRTVYNELISKFPVEIPFKPALVISGAHGFGKGPLLTQLLVKYPILGRSVPHTTRNPRPEEEHGVHYNFISTEEFKQMKDDGEFVETSEVDGNYYGTSFGAVRSIENKNQICLLDLEVNGVKFAKEKGILGKFVFIHSPTTKIRSANSEEAINIGQEDLEYVHFPGSYDLVLEKESQDSILSALEHYIEDVWKL